MKSKRIAALVVSALFAIQAPTASLAAAVNTDASVGSTTAVQKSGILEMTLEQAIAYAKENNKGLKDLKDACEDAFSELQDLKTETQKMQNRPSEPTYDLDPNPMTGQIPGLVQYALRKGYTLQTAQQGYNELLKTKEQTEQMITYSIEKLVYQIEETEKSIAYQKKAIAKAQKDLTVAKLKLELKMINQDMVDMSANVLNQINAGLKATNDGLVIAKNSLKTLLGVDRTVTLKIKPVIKEFKALGDIDIAALQDKAAQNRIDAMKLTDALNNAKMDYEMYEHFKGAVNYDDYKDKLDAYNKEKDNYEKDMSDIKEKVNTAYQAVLTSEIQYTNAVQANSIAAENHRVNEVKYSLGMISLIDLMASELAKIKAENDMNAALDNNILANRKFVASYTVGDIE